MESRVLSGATSFGLPLLRKPAARLSGNYSFPTLRPAGNLGGGGNLVWGRQLRPTILLESLPESPINPVTKRENLRPRPVAASSTTASGSDSAGSVSVIHLFVGVVYCFVSWTVGLPKRAPIDSNLIKMLIPVAVCHALGHVATNVSFAAVAISFTHTIKALEPFFNVSASQFILCQHIPLRLWLSLAPVIIGVSMASLTELSFNWTGFVSAMISNVSFTCRNLYSKKATTDMDSTNLYAYISIIALVVCIPPAIILEGPQLMKQGFNDAIAKVGMKKFATDLFCVGICYHLYNQLATNTLERVAPQAHAVLDALKRVLVIGFSILVFGNTIPLQTGIGTSIAIAGLAIYSFTRARMETKP